VVVPRFGHTAVDRNRLKRRLRELVRTEMLPRIDGLDVVLWAQAAAYRLSYTDLGAALQRVLSRMEKGSQPGG